MKTLGLVGGTSWHSTIEYYRSINQSVNDHFGNNTNPPLLLWNMNQALVHRFQVEDDWDSVADLVIDGARRLEKSGAEAIMLCANTPHKICDKVESQLSIPLLHIADATAKAIQRQNLDSVCFIGTRFSMTEDFVTGRIAQHGIEVQVPSAADEISELHRIIQKELTFGQVKKSSKQYVLDRLQSMIAGGAKGVILGCTEFPLMIKENQLDVPIFNTTQIHAAAATEFVLGLKS